MISREAQRPILDISRLRYGLDQILDTAELAPNMNSVLIWKGFEETARTYAGLKSPGYT